MTLATPPSEDSHLPSFDPSVPNPARMWNYWLGGKDNFAPTARPPNGSWRSCPPCR